MTDGVNVIARAMRTHPGLYTHRFSRGSGFFDQRGVLLGQAASVFKLKSGNERVQKTGPALAAVVHDRQRLSAERKSLLVSL